MKQVSRNIPLAEITLRRYEKPYDMRGFYLVKDTLPVERALF